MDTKKVTDSTVAEVGAIVSAANILNGNSDISAIDFSIVQNRDAMLQALNQRQTLAYQLDITNANHRDVLKLWIKSDYKNLLVLKKEQLHKDFVDAYLYAKFTEKSDSVLEGVSIVRSFSMQHMICYNYTTKAGETVDYFDKTLGVPTSLKTNAVFKFKIVDALALVKKIDIELSRVDLRLVMSYITNNINDGLKSVLFKVINKNGLSYFDLSSWYPTIQTELFDKLNEMLSESGLLVSDVRIINITIPNNTGEMLEQQYFALAEQAHIKEYENKLEEKSLELYAKKAEIHSKYPQFPLTLTEAEKDMALNRYLIRLGKDKELVKAIESEKLDERAPEDVATATTVKIEKPTAPVPPKKNNTFLIVFCVLAAVVAIAGIVLTVLLESKLPGILILAIGAVAFTVLGILNRSLLCKGLTKAQIEEYVRKKKEYEVAITEYNAKMSEAD